MRYHHIHIFIIYILTSLPVFSQTRRIDELKNNIRIANTEEGKLQATLILCNQGYTLNPDTLMVYASQAENLAKKQDNLRDEVRAKYYRAYALTNKGLIDSSLALADECLLHLINKISDPVLEANLLNQKGRCYMRKNQYKEAIDLGYQVIRKAEQGNDTLLQMQGKTLIGWAHLEMGQTRRSLYWHLQALNTTTDTLFVKKYGILFANIALNYNALGNKDSAFYYIKRAVEYSRLYENLFALSNSLAIQAQLLIGADKASLAETSLKEVIEIRKMIGDPFYIVSDMAQLGLYYAHNGQPEKGIAICNEGLEIANKYKIDTKFFFLYTTLAENYKVAGNMPQYAIVLERLLLLKDSVYRMNSEEALAELQAKYEVQKKETTIIQQKLDLTKKNYWLWGSLIVMFLAVVAAYFIFKNYKRKQQIQLLLMLEKEKRISEKAVLDAEENERKRIAADLHDNLGAYAASIASNIDQIKIVPTEKSDFNAMQELRNNSQSIVSQLNDTIWVLKKDALSLTAISDRLKIFIQRMQPSYPDVKIDVLENIVTDHLLPPSQAFHLFQVLQEAVNNALRHSNSKQITVIIDGDHSWKIAVVDDGKGFTTTMNKDGNGLANMKNRSKEAGWIIEWLPNIPSGTKLIIVPTTN